MVIHRDGGKVLLAESSEAVGIGAADIGHADERKLSRGVIIASAEEEQGAQLLLALKDRTGLYLVRVRIDEAQHHVVAALVDLAADGLEHVGKEEVAHAAHDDAYRVRLAADKVTRAVVGNVALGLDDREHPAAHGLAHIRPVVEHTRDGAHADPALLGNVLDRHGTTAPDPVC